MPNKIDRERIKGKEREKVDKHREGKRKRKKKKDWKKEEGKTEEKRERKSLRIKKNGRLEKDRNR